MNGTRVVAKRGQSNRRVTAVPRRNSPVRPRAVQRPPHPRFAWYLGLAVMAAIEVIEWPLAVAMMVGHEVAHRAHSRALRDFAEGVEAGA